MLLAWCDEGTELVCSTAARADAVWGPSGRDAVGRCCDVLADTLTLGGVRTFRSVTVSLVSHAEIRVIAVRREQAEVITRPIDAEGTLLPISLEDDMDALNEVRHLQVVQVSWAGRLASHLRAA